MRPRARLAPIFAALFAATACTVERADVRTPGGESPESDTTQIRLTVQAIATALETGDLAAFNSIYHDSVTIFEDGVANSDWATYRDEHLIPVIESLVDPTVEFADIRVRFVGFGTALATCRYRTAGTYEGRAIEIRGVATLIFRRFGSRWRLMHLHTSSIREY
jgi:ketosteroid isomerase-like protein